MASNKGIQSLNNDYKASNEIKKSLFIKSTISMINLNPPTVNTYWDFLNTENQITVDLPNGERIQIASDKNGTGELELSQGGEYLIRYSGTIREHYPSSGRSQYYDYSFYFKITAVENKLPLKKWTVTEVINRLLDVAEPIRRGEKPRFRLNGMRSDGTIITPSNKREGEEVGQAYKFDKVLSPQFSFTKQTLRECLQEIGKVIHGEPRLVPKKDGDKYYYEVYFELYGQTAGSGIYVRRYFLKYVSQAVDSYTNWIDSNAENLINQVDKFGGVIVEPYKDGAKTVRTENLYVRITEDNMLIPTQYPIYSVDKLEWVYKDGNVLRTLNLTPWLFERSIYDTQLSSYSEQYPYSKAYGLYFTQGEKNIGGLNFKVDAAVAAVFKNYAILNILRQASGNNDLKVDYPTLSFRVTYTPIYNVRVAQTKVNYKDFKTPAALIYNQGSNIVESRYYGENLKGAVARLGNVEKSKIYRLCRLYHVPKVGQMFDKDYYISSVIVQYLPTCMLCTVGLSKDFNRLSQYIGVDSEKRYSEISQTQAVERNTLWREYIVVGEKETPDTDTYIDTLIMAFIAWTFVPVVNDGVSADIGPITNVTAWGSSYKGNDIQGDDAISLPVISSAFGNSISFSWRYEDNYSAGAISHYENVAGGPQGYFQNNQPYCDYYGRIYYYNFDLSVSGELPDVGNLEEIGTRLPQTSKPAQSSRFVSTIGREPIILRKDNREILQCNFQIDFVTNLENMIIGSALASYSPAVRGNDAKLAPKLYVFPEELNKFTDHVEAFTDVNLNTLPYSDLHISIEDGYVVVTADKFPASGKSWAIVTKQYTKTEKVEDEQGNEYEQREVFGGDLLIGRNIEVTAEQEFTPIYFTKKREIFDRTVWKDDI